MYSKNMELQSEAGLAELAGIIAATHKLLEHPHSQVGHHLFIHLCVHVSVHPSICSSVRVSVHPPICLSLRVSLHPPSVRPSVYLSIHPSVRPFVYLSIHSSVRPSVHPSMHPSVRPSVHPCVQSFTQSICMFTDCYSSRAEEQRGPGPLLHLCQVPCGASLKARCELPGPHLAVVLAAEPFCLFLPHTNELLPS